MENLASRKHNDKEVNNKNKHSYCKTPTKCLYSPFYIKEKKLNSIFPCKQSKDAKQLDKDSYFLEPRGPLIVTHKESRKKIKQPKRRFRFEEEKIEKYTYFDVHKECVESEYYWYDLKHPKILRHYSKDKIR
jgi:hypothetical protein